MPEDYYRDYEGLYADPYADYGNYQTTPAVDYSAAPAVDYGAGYYADPYADYGNYQSLPADTTEQMPVGGLTAATAPTAAASPSGPYGIDLALAAAAANPNITEEEFNRILMSGPRAPMAATMTFENPLAAARNAGLPSNLQYGSVTMNANPNFDPNAQFSLPPGAELTMTQDEINNARVLWQNQNATYQPKSWMISTGPTGAGAVNMSLVSGNPYVLRNNKTGEIVAQGSDDATLEKIANLISGGSLGDEWQLFEPGTSSYGNVTFGQPDAWGNTGYGNSEYVEGANGQPGYWLNPIAGAKPAPSVLGNLLTHALTMFGPALVAPYLAPALSGPGALGSKFLGNVAAGALTGGAASGITGGDILKGALTGGAAAGALYGLGSVVGPGANTPSTGGGSSGGGGSTVPSSVYTGDVAPITVIGSSVTPTFGVPGLFNQVPTSVNTNKLEAGRAPTTVDSTGINPMEYFAPMVDGGAFDLGGALPAAEANQIVAMAPSGGLNMAAGIAPAVAQIGYDIATGNTQVPDQTAPEDQNQIVVEAAKPITALPPYVSPFEPYTLPDVPQPSSLDLETYENTPITVEGRPTQISDYVLPAVPPLATLPSISQPSVPEPTAPEEEPITVKGTPPDQISNAVLPTVPPLATLPDVTQPSVPGNGTSLSDIIDYLRLAGLGTSLIGSLFGGSSQQGATLPGGFGTGNLNSTFNKPLPGANIPGLGGGTSSGPRTAADLGQQGLSTTQDYYRYGYGPEQSFFNYVQPTRPNTSTAYTGYAKGGFAVEGPGDGREDKIPAMLSDGEYVMDAETVAMLGNGSNKAGAEMLDKFRVNLRKHKGREMARGKFSKSAKKPEQYLAGGRT